MAWQPGTIFKIRGVYIETEKYGPKVDLVAIRIADAVKDDGDYDPAEFLEATATSPAENLAAIRAIIDEHIQDEPLTTLVQAVLSQHEAALLVLPATAQHFYPMAGGWLAHVRHVLENSLWLTDTYAARFPDAKLNRDLVLAAAALHDIGRVAELTAGPPGAMAETTIPGRLLGHVALGRDILRDAARNIEGLNPELLLLLDHLVQVHLVLPEWGSPRLPMIPEALILHHADDLDAKLEMYLRHIVKDASPGPFTDRDPVLGKSLLKSRIV
jgi:3'-5' exoribonuclease